MNIVLVGMPGAGKSTIGVLLAKRIAFDFIDTDILIQHKTGETLQDTMDREGYLKLRAIEEEVLLDLDIDKHVISTGGSAVYGAKGMENIKKNAKIVFIKTTLNELKRRVSNYETRGIARRPDQSFQDLFQEREILYNKYADIVIESLNGNQDGMIEEIVNALEHEF
jgi:shikimate kinase